MSTPVCINWRMLVLFSTLLLLSYSNTFNASWHLDDFPNITQNPRIQINNLFPATLFETAFGDTTNNRLFFRPVSNFSLALNWFYSQDKVTGYHIVNTLVHILTAFFLYLAVLILFKTPNLAGKHQGDEYFIAVLAAVLWAANPIQTQAVTYIVQRMASMAAMFYVLGIYLYIKARTSVRWKNRATFYTGVFFAFFLAIGSKENALMFPGALFLIEIIFFQNLSDSKTRRRFIFIGSALTAGLFILGVLAFMDGGFVAYLSSKYEMRPFSLVERLLTEPRIVVFYLSQIFYPIADRLSIVHDIEVSTSLFRPWQTLPAILFLFGLAATGVWQITKRPLFAFAVLFFLLNHIIESTIIPLELIFEHRNYLPSLFLFMPVAAGLKWAMDYYAKRKKAMVVLLTSFTTLLVMILGIGTYVRNMAWANEYTLWQDALEKAPGSSRPYHNLAAGYYADMGNYEKVIELCNKAKDLNENTRHKAEILALENKAIAYDRGRKDYNEVIKIYKRILDLSPNKYKTHYHLVLALIKTGELDKAQKRLIWLISEDTVELKYLTVIALIHLQKNEPEKALPYLVKAIQKAPDDAKAGISIGLAKLMTEKYNSAAHYLRRISGNSADDKTTALLLLIENSVRAGNHKEAEEYAEKLAAKANPEVIREKLEEANEPGLVWPISTELVAPVIADVLRQQSITFSDLPNTDEENKRS